MRARSIVFGLTMFASAIASCAESDTSPPVLPPPEDPPPALGPIGDAAPEPECQGDGSDGCAPRALSCAEADFCEVPTNIDGRYSLLGVWGSSGRDVWAAGSGGTILHWDGTVWTHVPVDVRDTLFGVGGSGVSDVWFVSSTDVILHTTGFGTAAGVQRWPSVHPLDDPNRQGASLSKVWVPAPGHVVVASAFALPFPRDTLWRFRFGVSADDRGWDAISTFCNGLPCAEAGIEGIWGPNPEDIWVIGKRGEVRRSKGPVGKDAGTDQWLTMETTRTTANLHGIWGSSASDVWIVGDRGTIRHWSEDGSQRWEVVPSPTNEDLRAVWGTGPNDAWAVGDAGTILHWDGTSWRLATTTLPPGSKPRLSSVWAGDPNDVWVVGDTVALHFGAKPPLDPTLDGGPR